MQQVPHLKLCFLTDVAVLFSVVGCPDPVLPKGAWYKRNLDKVAVHCNKSSETWFLYCSGNKWVGPTRNCSQGKTTVVFLSM